MSKVSFENYDLGGQERKIAAGTLLIRENELSRKLFIIREGKVRVFKTYLSQKITLAILGEGEVFGELSFFDAEPRSASVEALTDLLIFEIDGDQAMDEIDRLPSWIIPLFKSVFYRFRELDNKVTVLQNLNEFRKRSFNRDDVAKTIYLELQRFNKMLEIMVDPREGKMIDAPADKVIQEMNDMLGAKQLGLQVYFKMLRDFDLIDNHVFSKNNKIEIIKPHLESFKKFLAQEVESERYLLLSHPALAVLRKMIGHVEPTLFEAGSENVCELNTVGMGLNKMALSDEGLVELEKHDIIKKKRGTVFHLYPSKVFDTYTYQSLLKNFDHTIFNVD